MYTTPERAYFNLGEAYRAKGDPANAEAAYRRALRATRSTPPPMFPVFRRLRRAGEVERRGGRPQPVRGGPSRLRLGLDGTGSRLPPAFAAGGSVEGVRQGSRGLERSGNEKTGGRVHGAPRSGEAMTSGPAGASWKELRDVEGKTIDQVSAELRIGHRYLAGIEEGNFGDFPERVFSTGFIRSYAKYLSQDPARPRRDERSIGRRSGWSGPGAWKPSCDVHPCRRGRSPRRGDPRLGDPPHRSPFCRRRRRFLP